MHILIMYCTCFFQNCVLKNDIVQDIGRHFEFEKGSRDRNKKKENK